MVVVERTLVVVVDNIVVVEDLVDSNHLVEEEDLVDNMTKNTVSIGN